MSRSQSRTSGQGKAKPGKPPKGATRTAQRSRHPHEYRGGEWGYGVAERLRRLKGGLGVRRFAESVDLSPSLVSSYLNGGRLPDAQTLRTISERTNVSLDWLLFGEGGDAPVNRGQWRTEAGLAADLGAYLRRALIDEERSGALHTAPSTAAQLRRAGTGDPAVGEGASRSWLVDGEAALHAAVAREIEQARSAASATEEAQEAFMLAIVLEQKARSDPRADGTLEGIDSTAQQAVALLRRFASERMQTAWNGRGSALPVNPPVEP